MMLMNNRDNVSAIRRCSVPVYLVSSARDELVPPRMMRALEENGSLFTLLLICNRLLTKQTLFIAKHAPFTKFQSYENALHMNCFQQPGYYEHLSSFVNDALDYRQAAN